MEFVLVLAAVAVVAIVWSRHTKSGRNATRRILGGGSERTPPNPTDKE